MFRPPPTVIEIGSDEDIQQFEDVMRKKSPESSIKLTPPRLVFNSPAQQLKNGIITPSLSLSDSFNGSPV